MDSDASKTVVLTVACTSWHDAIDGIEPLALRIVRATLEAGSAVPPVRETGEVSLLLTDDTEIRALNERYRGQDRATNVLSFPGLDLIEGRRETPLPPGPVLLGDVVISFEHLRDEAAGQEKTLIDHFAHLLTHGTLHLLGYDHQNDAEAAVMEGLEASILKTLRFAAPYPPETEMDAMSTAHASTAT